jgi:hypothetical protein
VARSASGPGPVAAAVEDVTLEDDDVAAAEDEEDEDEEEDEEEDVDASPPPLDEHPDSVRAPAAAAQTRDLPNFRVVVIT